jgi:hypothetical protein
LGTNLDRRPETMLRGSSILGGALAHSKKWASRGVIAMLMSLKKKLGSADYGPIYDLTRLRINGELDLAEGSATSAVKEFRKADVIDSPITDRDYLARALIATAAAEPNPTARRKLQEEALAAYARTAENPQVIWYYSPHYPPGFLANQIEDYLKIGSSIGAKGEATQRSRANLERLRGNQSAIR